MATPTHNQMILEGVIVNGGFIAEGKEVRMSRTQHMQNKRDLCLQARRFLHEHQRKSTQLLRPFETCTPISRDVDVVMIPLIRRGRFMSLVK